MRKSTIWILAIIMAVAFFGLLYQQIKYVRSSIQMREELFDESVKRSLTQVAENLIINQTKMYLFEDIEKKYANKYASERIIDRRITGTYKWKVTAPDKFDFQFEYEESGSVGSMPDQSIFVSPNKRGGNTITRASQDIQTEMIRRYWYEKENVEDVVAELLESPSRKPIEERIDPRALRDDIRNELKKNNIELPFFFEIVDMNNKPIFRQSQFTEAKNKKHIFNLRLFPNDPLAKQTHLVVHFPLGMDHYVFQEVTFLVPAVMFTLILLVTFIVVIYIAFRQKKLSEMKSDFMNNMTHELKTPVSTISLAAQMLKDGSIMKSPDVFKHISGVISDETERLSFQVEKVLQMSLFERQKATLKFKGLEMNDVVASVANTFQLKVEKFGGTIDIDLQATDDVIDADKMHITNVLFNLLDNAVKYRQEDIPLELMIRTWNTGTKTLNISVEDNGTGMRKDDVKKIFERFYRVSTGNRHDVKGFGLGLAYVKKIIEDHSGSIKAESELGKGTKFIMSLPLPKMK